MSPAPLAAESRLGSVRREVGQRVVVWSLGIAIGYGALEQGAYYETQRATVVAAVALALGGWFLLGRRHRRPLAPAQRVAVGCWAALGGWALVAGGAAGDVGSGLAIAVVSVMLAAALLAAASLEPEARTTLQHVIVAAGLLVAVTAWAGVAQHRQPWALPSQSLWRGSSTLTYANATAAFLVPPMVLVARRVVLSRSAPAAALLTLLAVGWTSTLSRGGALSLMAGVLASVVLVRPVRGAWARGRATLRALSVTLPGVVVGFAALVPSLPERAEPRAGLAAAGLVAATLLSAAVAIVTRPTRRPRHRRARPHRPWRSPVVAVLLLGGLAGLGWVSSGSGTRGAIADAVVALADHRFSRGSSDRSDLQRVTWRQFSQKPFLGVGPGRLNLRYIGRAGQPVRAKYTHNEYLQLGAEVGAPGLVLAVGGLVALAWPFAVRNGNNRLVTRGSRAAGLVVIATFAVHSGLDFLWHISAIPLLVVATAGSVPNGDSDS